MSNLESLFLLDPTITFLNFGSFGACPKPVFEDYQKWQRELENEPVQFMTVNSLRYLQQSRQALGEFIHCEADDLVYVPNPSHAINIITKSIGLQPGDEILSTDLEYGACDKTWDYYCSKSKAVYKRQPITLPLISKDKFIEDFFAGLTSKTKAVFISHITSSTGLILPVKEVCAIAKQKGLLCIVDGAHAPGHLELNLNELGADIYTGACHKWMLTAKGCSFLYIRKELQDRFDPLVVSWGYNSATPSHSKFLDYHQLQGTRDISAFLTVPRAIQFMQEYNWQAVSDACKILVKQNAETFFNLLETKALAPISDEFIGQMLSVPIRTSQPEKLQQELFNVYSIDIPVMRHADKTYIRYSINAFNSQKDLDTLYGALKIIKSQKRLID